jgi:hypothetical protein
LAAVLLSDRQFAHDASPPSTGRFATVAVWLVLALTAANFLSTLLECGFKSCAGNPVVYELLKHGT